jgi:hypothetical protein
VRRLRVAPTLGLAVALAAGCGSSVAPSSAPPSAAPSVGPSGPPVLGLDWGRATSVERPANFEQTVPPDYPGTHPILRINGQAYMVDVVGLPAGGFVAVGYLPPDWTPVSWTSPDGETWAIHAFGTGGFTFPVAVSVGADGTIVAVGRSGTKPVAWTSRDGASWRESAVPVLGTDGTAERMTSVVAGPGGFLAGGSVGPELLDRHARFWTSPDGATWTAVADDRATFANAEVRSIARLADGFVAVGVVGTAQLATAAVAWTSPDGRTWSRVDDPAFSGGVAASVVAAPFGGLVAVGSDVARREATAWTSPDGRTWLRSPGEASRRHGGGFAWMTDVAALGDQVIAVGDVQGLQRGTAESWVSRDGLTWEQSRTSPVQEQGEMYAIAAGGPGAIAVGSFGAPDSYVPTVWLTPGRG